MIKKLTIALLLLATGTLFAQISNPVAATFAVKTAEGVEAEMPISLVQSLSPDLPYYFNRNVVQLMAASRDDSTDYTNWANNRWDASGGTHGDDATNYLTDAQSISLTGSTSKDGIHIDFTNTDLTQFVDGDTSVAADYICWAIYITTQDIADLYDTDGLVVQFPCDPYGTYTNWFTYSIDDSDLSNGCNYFKVAKSAFEGTGACTSDTAWALVKGFAIALSNNVPDDEVVLSIDNIQMVRDDPDAAEPNPFQTEGPNGTWTADWTQEGNGNIWVVEESNVVSAMSGDGTSSHLKTATQYLDYSASGITRISSASTGYLWTFREPSTAYSARLSGDSLIIEDSTGATHGTTFSVDNSDIVYWKAERKGTSISILTSLTGENYTGRATFGKAGAQYPGIYFAAATQRLFAIGFSGIEYAAEAGMAYRVEYLFYRNDTLFVKHAGTTGDSLAAIVPDVILKE